MQLGEGLLALERGDTLEAARLVEAAGSGRPALEGGAELALLAGRLYARGWRTADAERLLAAAAATEAPAAAAAASLELARLHGNSGRREEAVARLEALILAWPGSAVAPDARRLMDALRGATPMAR